jgi:hypothetical protein
MMILFLPFSYNMRYNYHIIYSSYIRMMKKIVCIFLYLKNRQYVTLLCICGNYKNLSFLLEFIVFDRFHMTNNFDPIFRPSFRFRPDQKYENKNNLTAFRSFSSSLKSERKICIR